MCKPSHGQTTVETAIYGGGKVKASLQHLLSISSVIDTTAGS